MDVWFDSGVSWAAVVEEIFMNYEQQQQQKAAQSLSIEKRNCFSPWKFRSLVSPRSNRNENKVADLYIEGSDQHRGWFNSSLLTSGKVFVFQFLSTSAIIDCSVNICLNLVIWCLNFFSIY
jgi:isoleucyl-tRNA synthetase